MRSLSEYHRGAYEKDDKSSPFRGMRKGSREPVPPHIKALQTKIRNKDRFKSYLITAGWYWLLLTNRNAEGPWLIEKLQRSFCEMNGFDRFELIGKDIRLVSKETAAIVEMSNKSHEKISGGPGRERTHRREYYQRLKQGPIS